MNTHGKEIAKFACGFETFHALFHGYLLLSRTPFNLFGIEVTPALSLFALVFNGAVALWLGAFAWRQASPI